MKSPRCSQTHCDSRGGELSTEPYRVIKDTRRPQLESFAEGCASRLGLNDLRIDTGAFNARSSRDEPLEPEPTSGRLAVPEFVNDLFRAYENKTSVVFSV